MKQTGTGTPDAGLVVAEYSSRIRPAFMGRKLAPVMMVDRDQGHYDLLQFAEMQKVVGDIQHADGAGFAEIVHSLTQDSYKAYDYGLEEPIPNAQKLRNVSFDTEAVVGQTLMRLVMLKEEIRWATAIFNATTFTSYKTDVSTEWSNVAASIIKNVAEARLALVQQVGGFIDPIENEIVLGVSDKVFANMQNNTEIKASAPGGTGSDGTSKQLVSHERMATILGIDAVESSSLQWDGADIWDDEYAMLQIRAKNPSSPLGNPNQVAQLARTLVWDKMVDVEEIYEIYEDLKTDSVRARVRQYQDEKILNVRAGHLLYNVTA